MDGSCHPKFSVEAYGTVAGQGLLGTPPQQDPGKGTLWNMASPIRGEGGLQGSPSFQTAVPELSRTKEAELTRSCQPAGEDAERPTAAPSMNFRPLQGTEARLPRPADVVVTAWGWPWRLGE